MTKEETDKSAALLLHDDLRPVLESGASQGPWFVAYSDKKTVDANISWYSAVVPADRVTDLASGGPAWDVCVGDGTPTISTIFSDAGGKDVYLRWGNNLGIEPLVVYREFHGMRRNFFELSQEFCLFHNLFAEPSKQRFVRFDENGDEHEAARYEDNLFEIRAELVHEFCLAKNMVLARYVDSLRHSKVTLADLGLVPQNRAEHGPHFNYSLTLIEQTRIKGFKATSRLLAKQYVHLVPKLASRPDVYQDFIIGQDETENLIRHTCDPEKLADFFGKNEGAPNYLTPVFFRPEVLTKYYADPDKYVVQDGYLRCGGLWSVHIDNDHEDVVAVYLGDLGRDLSETERNYWLSFNIAPAGREISKTAFKRGVLAEFADPERSDLVFKSEYENFRRAFGQAHGWDFFLALHASDRHYWGGLKILTKDNQAEFDSQLLALTKIVVDSLNEKGIARGLNTLVENDKGITKLEKYFQERGDTGFEPHVKFLRGLQDLRSKSAAHRKGSSYDALVSELELPDEGQKKVFAGLLKSATNFIQYLSSRLLAPASN